MFSDPSRVPLVWGDFFLHTSRSFPPRPSSASRSARQRPLPAARPASNCSPVHSTTITYSWPSRSRLTGCVIDHVLDHAAAPGCPSQVRSRTRVRAARRQILLVTITYSSRRLPVYSLLQFSPTLLRSSVKYTGRLLYCGSHIGRQMSHV